MGQPKARKQSKLEADISDEMMAFQREFVGRGPDRIHTYVVDTLVVVRSFGVLTPAEKQIAEAAEGRSVIKSMRQQVLGAGREVLEGIIRQHAGGEILSVHSDISTTRDEWMEVFVLDRSVDRRLEEGSR